MGYEPASPPPKFVEYFARGDTTEVEVKRDLERDGWRIEREQDEVTVDVTDEIKVVGHLDGVIWTGMEAIAKHRVLEIKRMADPYWRVVKDGGWYVDGLMEKYRWQISAYMIATGLEVVLVCRNGDTGEDLYLYAEEPFHPINDIKARVLSVEGRARSFATLDDVGQCDSADFPCPFYYTHLDEGREDAAEDTDLLEGLGIAFSLAQGRERAAKDEVKRIRDEISAVVGDRLKVNAGRVKITKFVSRRTSLDRRRIERDGIDLSEYESTKEYDGVRITVGDDDRDDSTGGV